MFQLQHRSLAHKFSNYSFDTPALKSSEKSSTPCNYRSSRGRDDKQLSGPLYFLRTHDHKCSSATCTIFVLRPVVEREGEEVDPWLGKNLDVGGYRIWKLTAGEEIDSGDSDVGFWC